MNEEHTAGTPEEEQNSTNSQTLKGTPYKAFPTVMGMKEVIDKLVEIEARIAKLESLGVIKFHEPEEPKKDFTS